jgi:hypothetical protein
MNQSVLFLPVTGRNTKRVGRAQSGHHHVNECNVFSPWYSWKQNTDLEFNNNHPLTDSKLFVLSIIIPSFYDFDICIGIVPTVWYFFSIFLQWQYWKKPDYKKKKTWTSTSDEFRESDDDLSLVSMCQKRTMGYHRCREQKLGQQEIHKKWYQVTQWIMHLLRL